MNPWVHLHGHLPKIYGRYIWVPSGINHIIRWCDTPLAFCILATHTKKRTAINHSSEKQKPCRSRHKDVVSTSLQRWILTSEWRRDTIAMEMLVRHRNTTLFQRLIAMSRQRCINVRTTANDVDKGLFKRRNATLERCISTLYQHFHCDVRSTSVFDVIYGCLNVVMLRCLDVNYGRLDLCSIFLNQTRYICFALEKRVKSTYG